MRIKMVLPLIVLSFLFSGFRSLPCIQTEHDCCRLSLSPSFANPYTTCCDEDKDDKKGNPSLQSRVGNDVALQVAVVSIGVFHFSNPSLTLFAKIQNKSPPKTSIYLQHESLLL